MSYCKLCENIGTYDKAGHAEECGEWYMELFSDYTQLEGDEADWRKGILFGRFGESNDPKIRGTIWHEEAFFPARFCPLCGREL